MARPPLPWQGDAPPDVAMRPRCPDCGKPLQPSVERLYEANLVTPYARRWRGTWDAYQGLWCTLRCALRFATRAHAAGFRRVRGS